MARSAHFLVSCFEISKCLLPLLYAVVLHWIIERLKLEYYLWKKKHNYRATTSSQW